MAVDIPAPSPLLMAYTSLKYDARDTTSASNAVAIGPPHHIPLLLVDDSQMVARCERHVRDELREPLAKGVAFYYGAEGYLVDIAQLETNLIEEPSGIDRNLVVQYRKVDIDLLIIERGMKLDLPTGEIQRTFHG